MQTVPFANKVCNFLSPNPGFVPSKKSFQGKFKSWILYSLSSLNLSSSIIQDPVDRQAFSYVDLCPRLSILRLCLNFFCDCLGGNMSLQGNTYFLLTKHFQFLACTVIRDNHFFSQIIINAGIQLVSYCMSFYSF